jgi:hypothetical protein
MGQTSVCKNLTKDGYKWLVYKIGQPYNYSDVLSNGTNLMIKFSSIKNPLHLKNYTYRLEIYYSEINDSLVAKT